MNLPDQLGADRTRAAFAVGLGVLGAFGLVVAVSRPLAARDPEDEEFNRGHVAVALAVALGGLAATRIYHLDQYWWLSIDSTGKRVEQLVVEGK